MNTGYENQKVRQYHNKWRATFTLDGVSYQRYYETEKLAKYYQFIMRKRSRENLLPFTFQTVKQRIAKHQDLPVGIIESDQDGHKHKKICYFFTDPKTKKMRAITCVFSDDGTTAPTRDQALKAVINDAWALFEEYEKESKTYI